MTATAPDRNLVASATAAVPKRGALPRRKWRRLFGKRFKIVTGGKVSRLRGAAERIFRVANALIRLYAIDARAKP